MIGQTLGHYRVVAKIAAGGMGVVYRAYDEHLDREVALKVLPPGTISSDDSRKRFRHEAVALAKLNHPNIETVHEFGSQDDTDYLAMELIAGQTLSEKLREGPFEEHEILRLGSQIANGLAAAHERNIIHRDIKPGNLMIMPDGRLKILDFGLAKLVQPAVATDLTLSVETDTGKLVGTIPYMSPEQVRGQAVDPRTDIFAAGAVLYEMATGHRPFPQSRSVELMAAILHKNPDPPSSLNTHLSPGLESVICKTLEKNPESRYHTARELKAALEGISATSHRPLSAPDRKPESTTPAMAPTTAAPLPQTQNKPQVFWLAGAGLAVMLTAGGLVGFNVKGIRDSLFHRTGDKSKASIENVVPPIKARKSVAVLGFKNVAGQSSKGWESTALAEMFTTDLGAGDQLRTISGEDIAQMMASLSLPDTDSYGKETLGKIQKNLNADFVVVGSYVPLPDGETRVDVRLQDTANGTTLATISRKGKNLDALVTDAGAELREKIGVTGVSLEESAQVQATMPSNPEAREFYSEGLAKLRAFDNVAAREALQKAVVADSNSAMIYSALAEAYAATGYDEKARQAARNASDLAKPLSPENRSLIEGRYHEVNKEWDRAIESYRGLFVIFSDNPEYGILLAKAEISGGHAKDALVTVQRLRDPASPSHNDPRVDLTAAHAALSLGDFKEALKQATAGETKARANGANLMVARSLLLKAQALESLNQLKEAGESFGESRAIYRAAGDSRGELAALEGEANYRADNGDPSGAISKYKEQLDLSREIGNRKGEASAMNNMALVLKQQGDSDRARAMWEQALIGFHDVSDKASSAEVLINLAGLSLEQGDLAKAKKTYTDAITIFRDVNDSSGVANTTAAIGTVLFAQGDCEGAKKLLEEAIKLDQAGGSQEPAADKLISLADVLQLQGDLGNAAEKYQLGYANTNASGDTSMAAYAALGLGQLAILGGDFKSAHYYLDKSLAMRDGLGEKRNVAVTQVALAQLSIEEGRFGDAVSRVTTARDDFRKDRDPDDELTATAVLIRAYLANGSVDQAQNARETARANVSKNQNLAARLDFLIASALLDASVGKVTTANAVLKKSAAEATKSKLVGYQLESQLTIAQVNAKSPKSGDSYTLLDKLQKEASDKGYGLIARKAAAMRIA
jgi:serine/threonine protein kinase/tetratricopeptide (TPR) repeat protein